MADQMESRLTAVEQRIDKADDERKAHKADLDETRALLAQVVDILHSRGDLNDGHKRLLGKVAERARRPATPKVKLSVIKDKYQTASPDVDCASLIPLCRARCCAFEVRVSEQDVREGAIEWNLRDPYTLIRTGDGYCSYLDREIGHCGCYDVRPGVCRQYDCRTDKRVWQDFEQRIPAELHPHIVPMISKKP